MRSFSELWPTLKRLLAYGSPWRKPLIIAVVMMWIAAAAEVSGPLLISYFIDNMVAKNSVPLKLVCGLAAAYFGLQILAATLHYNQSLLFNRAAVGVVQQLRSDVMDAALRQPLSEFDTQPVGQLISRVTNDTEVIRDLYVTVVATVLRSAALIGAMLVAHGAGGADYFPGGVDRDDDLSTLQHADRASGTGLAGRYQRRL